jgi:hypothetical protein
VFVSRAVIDSSVEAVVDSPRAPGASVPLVASVAQDDSGGGGRGRGVRRRSWSLLAAWVVLGGTFVLQLVEVLGAGSLWFLNRVPDDAYYYLEIAARMARGEGSTFDGINATNGYHPLWQAMLVPLAAVWSGDALIRATLTLGLVCVLAATLLVVRLVARVVGAVPAVVGAAFAVQFGMPHWVDGMESPVVLLTLALLATTLERAFATRAPRWCVAAGVASALVVLARFDESIVVVAVPVILVWHLRSVRALGRWVLGAGAIAVPFALAWLARWHHVLTTSATVKAHWAQQDAATRFGGRFTFGYLAYITDVGWSYLRELQPWNLTSRAPSNPILGDATLAAIASMAVLTLVVVATATWWRNRRTAATSPAALAASAALLAATGLVAVKAVVDIALSPVGAWSWYASPEIFTAGLAVGVSAACGARILYGQRRILGWIAVSALAIVLVPTNLVSAWHSADTPREVRLWPYAITEATHWITAHGPHGRYGSLDAGLAGYRLDGARHLVNLDGLVNSYAFTKYAKRGITLRTRVHAAGVDYYVNRLNDGDRHDLSCGRVLWTSSVDVPFVDPVGARTLAPIAVVDVRRC